MALLWDEIKGWYVVDDSVEKEEVGLSEECERVELSESRTQCVGRNPRISEGPFVFPDITEFNGPADDFNFIYGV